MTSPRNLLLIALLFISYLLWMQWQQDYHVPPAPSEPAASQSLASGVEPEAAIPDAIVPEAGELPTPSATATATPSTAEQPAAAPTVVVTTDVLRVEISLAGGNLVVADLLDYPEDTGNPTPVRLLDDRAATFFVAQSGLVSASGPAPDHQARFASIASSYSLAEGSDRLEVPLTWSDPSGLEVTKSYVFSRGSYVIEQRQEISNRGGGEWVGNAYHQLQRVPPVLNTSGIKGYANTSRYSFAGGAVYSPEDKFEKLKFDRFASDPLDKSFAGGWEAMSQHYFFAAWIPPVEQIDRYTTRELLVDGVTRYLLRSVSPAIRVAPDASQVDSARLYVGPKLQDRLEKIAPGLSLTIDYGMLTVISEPLHWVLALFEKLTGNWGIAIILLVLLIKALFFKLSEAQYRSMAKMRKLQPRIAALKERYGDDRQKMNTAMMELYKKEKANPLAGCLPMLIQIPVFFALYWVLLESVELRQAPFVGWIHNLSAPDPYYVLPVLNGLIMIGTQFLTPTAGMDPTQAKMMKAMPVVFAVVFAFFPAGLVLYYTVNGGLSLLQQWIITRRIEGGGKPARA